MAISLLLYLLFAVIFVADFKDFFQSLGKVGGYMTWIPDLLSIMLMAIVIFRVALTKRLALGAKYIAVGALMMLHMFNGMVINAEPAGAVVAGLRQYWKYLPLFLIPCVYEFTEKQIKGILKFLLMLSLMQFPVALFQRFFQYSATGTGDVVRGTLRSSGILSVYLISAIAMVWAFYLRGKISRSTMLMLLLLLFVPTTINETKGTVILIPLAFGVALFYNSKGPSRLKGLAVGMMVSVVLIGGFSVGYDQFYRKGGGGIVGFFETGDAFKELYKRREVGSVNEVKRVDSMVWAFEELRHDPVKLIVGLGIGNVSDPAASTLKGAYSEKYASYGTGTTTITYLLWETGFGGIILVILILYMLFDDARYLSSAPNFVGVMSLGWAGVAALFILALFYKNLIPHNAIGYVFWFLSGYVAAARYRYSARNVDLEELSRAADTAVPERGLQAR